MKSNDEDEVINEEGYKSMVDKVLYLVNKMHPVCLRLVQELVKHFSHQTKHHWEVLTRVIGYIKANMEKGRFLRKPKELRIVAYTDSGYANDDKRKSILEGVVSYIRRIDNMLHFKKSRTKAEYIPLGTITQDLLFQQQILNKALGYKYDKISIIHKDNLGVIYLTFQYHAILCNN